MTNTLLPDSWDWTGKKDLSASLQYAAGLAKPGTTLMIPPEGALRINGPVNFPDGVFLGSANYVQNGSKKGMGKIIRDRTCSWRIAPDLSTNPRGRCSAWQFDHFGAEGNLAEAIKNHFGLNYSVDGVPYGGFDATTEPAGQGYDGWHLKALFGQPWLGVQKGDVLQYLIASGTMASIQHVVDHVSPDGTQIFWTDFRSDPSQGHVDTSGSVAWCINAKGARWYLVFQDDPSWRVPLALPVNHVWGGYQDAIAKVEAQNNMPVINMPSNSGLRGVELIGPNHNRHTAITNYDKSNPLVNEFQALVYLGASSYAEDCVAHNAWGDAFDGPGDVDDCDCYDNGRGGTNGHHDYKKISGRFWGNRLADIDIEDPGHHSHVGVEIDAEIYGAGVAWSTALIDSKIHLRSTAAGLAACGHGSLSTMLRGKAWGDGSEIHPRSKNIDLQLQSDVKVGSTDMHKDAFTIFNADGINLHDSYRLTSGYLLDAVNCTGVSETSSSGGPNSLGVVNQT